MSRTLNCDKSDKLENVYIRYATFCQLLNILYNNPSYSRIFIGSRLWSIRRQTHDGLNRCKVFSLRVLKWRKYLRI